MTSKLTAAKRETLNVRVKSEDRNLIDRASRLLGKSRTEFLLESARRAAQDALLDQTLFRVSQSRVHSREQKFLLIRRRNGQQHSNHDIQI